MCGVAKKYQRPLNLGEYALKYGALAASHAKDQIERQRWEKWFKEWVRSSMVEHEVLTLKT